MDGIFIRHHMDFTKKLQFETGETEAVVLIHSNLITITDSAILSKIIYRFRFLMGLAAFVCIF